MTSQNVLLIDDDAANRTLLAYLLEKEGFDVTAAANGAEGLEAALQKKASCIVLDIFMPGQSGLSILNKLKAAPECADIPVVIFTIVATEELTRQALEAGAECVVNKPFEMKDIVETIKRYAGASQKRDAV